MTDVAGQTTGQAGQTTDQGPTVPTSGPWNMYVVLVALILVSVGAVLVLLTYRSVFDSATDVTTVLGSWFTVVGTIVGAYFGIKATSDANAQSQGTILSATNTTNQALGALDPRVASTIVGPAQPQGTTPPRGTPPPQGTPSPG
jgi:hypothetical protein